MAAVTKKCFTQILQRLVYYLIFILAPEDLGLDPNHILAREDLIAGEPASFQSELLAGINFLKGMN